MRFSECAGIDKPWSVITMGCWQIAPSGGWGDLCSEPEADSAVKAALDAGITAFDTAEGYGDGESERRLGKALGAKKNEVVIISKIWPDAELSFAAYETRLNNSLRALGRDYVDLYLVHFPVDEFSSRAGSEKLSEIMFKLKAMGKTKTIGLSNFRVADLKRIGEGLARYAVNQVPYSLLEREYEGDTRDLCEGFGVPYMAYTPTALGALAREMTPADLQYPARHHHPYFQEPLRSHAQKVFQEVRKAAEELNAKPVQVALAWVLAQDNILTAIVGSRKAGQIAELNAAADLKPSREHLKRLTAASDAYHKFKRGG